jgi:hypothetical protein
MVGALLGALHGTSWIPQYWFDGIGTISFYPTIALTVFYGILIFS